MIYKIIYKGKVIEEVTDKEVANNIAEMIRDIGMQWTLSKNTVNVKVVECSLN